YGTARRTPPPARPQCSDPATAFGQSVNGADGPRFSGIRLLALTLPGRSAGPVVRPVAFYSYLDIAPSVPIVAARGRGVEGGAQRIPTIFPPLKPAAPARPQNVKIGEIAATAPKNRSRPRKPGRRADARRRCF